MRELLGRRFQRFVADLDDDFPVGDSVPLDVPSEELVPMYAAGECHRNLRAPELGLPEQTLLACEFLRRHLRAVRQLERDAFPLVRHDDLKLDELGALVRRRIDHCERAVRDLRRDPVDGALRELAGDLFRFRVAHQHLRRHLVGRAPADRVVRRVLEHALPGLAQERLGLVLAVERL